MNHFRFAISFALACLVAPSSALAQYDEMMNVDEEAKIGSPERFTLTLNLGMYQPDDALDTFYGGDNGPYVGGEFHGLIYRIPYIGPIGAGVGIGWVRYDGSACTTTDCSGTASEDDKFTLWPLTVMASLRIDVLAREYNIPLVITPKVGLDTILFSNVTGGSTQDSGVSVGLRWAVEIALELDPLERRAARSLDEEWGINHTFIFFQPFGSTAGGTPRLGDPFAWTAGLGFVF